MTKARPSLFSILISILFAVTFCAVILLFVAETPVSDHYNREFLNFFWAFLAGVFSINIESYELSCKRVVQFVNGYSKPH